LAQEVGVRRAARIDSNQAEIIAALKSVGVSVEYIKQPFDLVIFNPRKRETAFVECKSPRPTSEGGKNGLTIAQTEFISKWPGPIYVVRSAEDAVRQVLGAEAFA
jgi:hypothetical protein